MLRQQVAKAAERPHEEGGGGDSSSGDAARMDDIAALLIANNDALMKEVQELRQHAAHQSHPYGHPSQAHHPGGPDQFASSRTLQVFSPVHEEPSSPAVGVYQQLYQSRGHFDHSTDGRPPTGRRPGLGLELSTPVGKGFPMTPSGNFTPRAGGNWTPMGMSGMGMGAGLGMFGPGPQNMLAGPTTPHGKQLLTRNLSQMNLPPEEWAHEVRDLNGQLVECLEQLYEREQELEEQQATIEGLEDTLVSSKQQLAALYYDFAKRCETWESREKEYKQASVQLHNERDDLQLRLRRIQEILDVVQKEDKDTLEAKLKELNRKVVKIVKTHMKLLFCNVFTFGLVN